MLMTINPSDHRPIYLQIVDEVRRAIAVGSLKAGEPVPSVRQAAATLRVNPNTVQQAYRELERAGVVHVLRGKGTFVTDGGSASVDRQELARSLAKQALKEAKRHGLSPEELIEALHLESTDSSPAVKQKDRS